MSVLRKKIESRIRKKSQEIQDLTEALEGKRDEVRRLEAEIQAAEAYVSGMRESLELAYGADGTAGGKRRTTLRRDSDAAKAREILQTMGKPLHITEILQLMEREDTRENRTSVGGTISHYVRKGAFFTRPAPNTFGLVEFEGDDPEGAQVLSIGRNSQ